MERQFVDRVDTDELLEVRNELHFQDLHVVTEPATRVRDRFREVIPEHAPKFAATWAATRADLDSVTTIHQLRYVTDQDERANLVNDLRTRTRDLGGRGGW